MLEGRQVQITLRDTDEARLLQRLTTLLQQYPVPQAPPASTPTGGSWCAVHQVSMKENQKQGRTWYSHQTPDGQWCKGR
jgi:hypothetical protein